MEWSTLKRRPLLLPPMAGVRSCGISGMPSRTWPGSSSAALDTFYRCVFKNDIGVLMYWL